MAIKRDKTGSIKGSARTPTKAVKKPAKRPAVKKQTRVRPTNPQSEHKGLTTTRFDEADIEPFAVTANDIHALNAGQFRRFMRDLLRNEVQALSDDATFVDNPGDGPDGGQDALTTRLGSGQRDGSMIPFGKTVWQYKAEQKPPSKVEFDKELSKPRPQEVFKTGGNYRFVAQQPRGKDDEVNDWLRSVAIKKRLDPDKVGFLAQASLVEYARRYPSLALIPFFERHLEQLSPFEDWASQSNHSGPFDRASRADALDRLTRQISTTSRPMHIRVLGPAGVGKTRLVLEALSLLDVGHAVVYAPRGTSAGFNEFLKWCLRTKARLILVVDECDESNADRLRTELVNHSLPILLITINKIEDRLRETSSREVRIHLEPMSDDDIVRILGDTGLLREQLYQIAHVTGGFVKLARVIAESAARDSSNVFDPSGLITVGTINQAVRSLLNVSEQAMTWLGVIALFADVDISSSEPDSDLAILAGFAAISIPQARIWIDTARKAQVLSSRGNQVFVTPSLLAVWLAQDVTRIRRDDLPGLLRMLPPRLGNAFSSQLGQLRYSREGVGLARELVKDTGPFGDLLTERQPWAREAFLALASVAKDEALDRLGQWLNDNVDAKKELGTDSMFERLFFRLIWRPEHFARSFRFLLAGLDAMTRPEESGLERVMAGSLQLSLANSSASFQDRFQIAKHELLDTTHTLDVRRLLVRALSHGVSDGTGDGYSRADVDIDGREYWSAKTWGEVWQCGRLAVQLLIDLLSDPEPTLQKEAAANLVDHARDFIWLRTYDLLLPAIPSILAIDPRIGALREELELAISNKDVNPDIDQAVRTAIDALPQDLAAKIRVLAEGWPLFRARGERSLPDRPNAEEVADEIVNATDRSGVIAHLFEPWAKNAGELITKLATHRAAFDLWPEILSAGRCSGQTWASALFLAVAHDSGAAAFGNVAVNLLRSEIRYDASVGAEAITRMQPNNSDVRELVIAIQNGRVLATDVRYAPMGRWTEQRDRESVAQLIRATAGAVDGTTMALRIVHAAESNLAIPDLEIITLLVATMFSVSAHDAWIWAQVATTVAKRSPHLLGTALIHAIGERGEDRGRGYDRWAREEVSDALDVCIEKDDSLAAELLSLWGRAPNFVEANGTSALLTHLDANALKSWATDERRQQALARLVTPSSASLVELLVEHFGPESPFGLALRQQLHPRVWSGSLRDVFRLRLEQVQKWVDSTSSALFREWAQTSVRWLSELLDNVRDDD